VVAACFMNQKIPTVSKSVDLEATQCIAFDMKVVDQTIFDKPKEELKNKYAENEDWLPLFKDYSQKFPHPSACLLNALNETKCYLKDFEPNEVDFQHVCDKFHKRRILDFKYIYQMKKYIGEEGKKLSTVKNKDNARFADKFIEISNELKKNVENPREKNLLVDCLAYSIGYGCKDAGFKFDVSKMSPRCQGWIKTYNESRDFGQDVAMVHCQGKNVQSKFDRILKGFAEHNNEAKWMEHLKDDKRVQDYLTNLRIQCIEEAGPIIEC